MAGRPALNVAGPNVAGRPALKWPVPKWQIPMSNDLQPGEHSLHGTIR